MSYSQLPSTLTLRLRKPLLLAAFIVVHMEGGLAQVAFTPPSKYVSVASYGARCDGVTDDAPAFNAALAAASPDAGGAGAVFVPSSPTLCRLGFPITFHSNETLFGSSSPPTTTAAAAPAAATLAPISSYPHPTASPLLVAINGAANVTISGLAFDGDAQNVSASGTLITVYNADHVLLNRVSVVNARGLAVIFAGAVTNSGVQDSYFANDGTYYLTHGGESDLANRAQTVVFCCGTKTAAGTWSAQNNFALHNAFNLNGFDNLTITEQTSFNASSNDFGGTYNGANIYCANTVGTVISANNLTGASGNGIDCFMNSYLRITGNSSWRNGAAGIQAAGTDHGWITGNDTMSNFRSASLSWSASHPGSSDSLHRGGITIGGQATEDGVVSSVTSYMIIEGNVSGNYAPYGTEENEQAYGIQVGTSACTLKTNSLVISSNKLVGNMISPIFVFNRKGCAP